MERGLNEIKGLVSDILKVNNGSNNHKFDDNQISVQISDLRRIVPSEMTKVSQKIHKL